MFPPGSRSRAGGSFMKLSGISDTVNIAIASNEIPLIHFMYRDDILFSGCFAVWPANWPAPLAGTVSRLDFCCIFSHGKPSHGVTVTFVNTAVHNWLVACAVTARPIVATR